LSLKTGRNDPCPCGSGKKLKKCCGNNMSIISWRKVANNLTFEHPKIMAIRETFFAVSDYLKANPNPGACHLLSSILFVLMREYQIDCVLRIGEVLRPDGKYFDHSWIEIDNLIFDVGIQLTYDEQKNPPVYAEIDLGSGKPTKLLYGAHSPKGLDRETQQILKTPFIIYMNGFPLFKDGAWEIVKKIGSKLGLVVNISTLREKYKDIERVG